MPSRNDSCPCGSGTKYKRCCLVRLDAVACELRERDAFVGNLTAWLKDEHERAIARGLAGARLDAYRVGAVVPGVCIELESLTEGTSARVGWRDGYEQFARDEIVVVRATSLPILWGPGTRFPAGGERRWRARLATLPAEWADAALALLKFHPDDVAEPLPDGVELRMLRWTIEDDDAVLSADPRSLREIEAKLEASVQELISARDEPLGASVNRVQTASTATAVIAWRATDKARDDERGG